MEKNKKYFINDEEVKKEIFDESLKESSEDLNEYEKSLIKEHMEQRPICPVVISSFRYEIKDE